MMVGRRECQPFVCLLKYFCKMERLSSRRIPSVTFGFQKELSNTILEQLQPLLPRIFSNSILLALYTSRPSFTHTIAPLHMKQGSQLE